MTSAKRLFSALIIAAAMLAPFFAAPYAAAETSDLEQPRPEFSHDAGIYDGDAVSVHIQAPDGYTVAYTTDGCTPTIADDSGQTEVTVTLTSREGGGYIVRHKDQILFPGDVEHDVLEDAALPQGRILCAALVSPSGKIVSAERRVFFLGEGFLERFPSCLVVSVCTDPKNLVDYYTGIMVRGAFYDRWLKTPVGRVASQTMEYHTHEGNVTQKGKDWERPCLVQIYDNGDRPAAEANAGMRIKGNVSRRYAQKSFNFYFRDEYGGDRLEYGLFEDSSKYKSFSLAAGGNNSIKLKYKEAFLEEMAEGLDLTIFKSRMAVLFLNGEYWGPYMLTEKLSDQFFRDRYGAKKGQTVAIKNGEVEVGEPEDIRLYEELASYAQKDLKDPEIYRRFCETVDVQSFADYCALRIYIGDADWTWEKNDVIWRSRDGGKWKFIPYDMEYSCGTYNKQTSSAERDHFAKALEDYPLLKAALENDEFRRLFLDTIREIGSVRFAQGRVTKALDRWEAAWKPLLDDYFRRFTNGRSEWKNNLQYTKQFFKQRYKLLIPKVEAWCREQDASGR